VTPSPYRYRALAAKLAEDLRAGRYVPASRLPSVRDLCMEHGASLATVTHALHDLEDAGLIEARPRRGFFASARTQLALAQPSVSSIELAGRRKRVMELAASREGCLSLGHLTLPKELLPLPALRRLMTQQLRADASLLAGGSVYGGVALREQLASHSARMGCRFDAEDIIVTHGESESLQLCLRLLTEPGDLVAVTSPAPLRVLELLASMGLHALEIPAHAEGGLSAPALAMVLREHKVAVCLAEPSFYRVTGHLLSDDAKQELVALLAKHQLPLIECDMMGDLYRGPHRPRPLKAFDHDEWVLYCGSFACITGTGFSLGYVASRRYRLQLRAARAVHGELLPWLTERVIAGFLAGGGFERHLRTLRRRLKVQVEELRAAVVAQFPEGTRVSTGEGGYALWLELPGDLDACTLLERARERGYTFVPGAVFSMGTQFDHCMRLTAGNPLDEARAKGIRTLGELAHELIAERPSLCAPQVGQIKD